ncbi:MAG: MCP four helix bundle domain-containing protein [Nitrospira sp.]|nr:MCP four helix bundle domain-containing protein [Nitrospira sp.]
MVFSASIRYCLDMRTIVISLLILLTGLWGGYSLSRVDQELRVIYAEYTLATTDLGHINAKLIRYRTSILRAIESDSQKDFESITSGLTERRAQIEQPIERFIKAANSATVKRSGMADELRELQAVKARLADYMATSDQTIGLIQQRWKTTSPEEAQRLRDAAEENAAERAGSKLIAVTLELDLLLEVVAKIAGEVRDEADRQLRTMSAIVIGISALLAGLVLFAGNNSRRPKSC